MGSKIRNFFKKLLGIATSDVKAGGSAFAKLVERDIAITEAKGRIIALEAAHTAKNDELAAIEAGRDKVHAASQALKSRIDSVLSTL